MCEAIRSKLEEHSYLIDPHTAVAFAAAEKIGYSTKKEPINVQQNVATLLATASPVKFEESVTVAIGEHKWTEYRTGKDFPHTAEMILEMEERPPTIYKAEESLSLSQMSWETTARDILVELHLLGMHQKATTLLP